jgi:hypothetical protein
MPTNNPIDLEMQVQILDLWDKGCPLDILADIVDPDNTIDIKDMDAVVKAAGRYNIYSA